MLSFVKNVEVVKFDQASYFVDLYPNADDVQTEQIFKRLKQNKAAFRAATDLLDQLNQHHNASIFSDVLAAEIAKLPEIDQNNFVNLILGGFKIITDMFNHKQYNPDARNKASILVMKNIIEGGALDVPEAITAHYPSFYEEARKDAQLVIGDALERLFKAELDINVQASIFATAFLKQHNTHQQNCMRCIMASMLHLEKNSTNACLLKKLAYMNSRNDNLPYI